MSKGQKEGFRLVTVIAEMLGALRGHLKEIKLKAPVIDSFGLGLFVCLFLA